MNQETDPLGHTLVSTVVEATCDTQGFIKNVCECGYEFLSNYVAPFGHDFTDTVIPAKCDTEGYTLHSCKSCDYSFSDEYVEAPGHTYIKYTVVPLCAKPGYTVYACACGFSYNSDYKAPLGHDLESKKVEPTCTAAGYTEYYCFCGYSYISDYVKPLDHNYTSTVTTDPTCITAGYTDYTCECGSTLRADYVDALGHVYSTEVTAPTCTEAGYTVNTCRCGDTYVSDIISATGHDFIKNKIMPTVSDMGYTEFTCRACDFKYTGNYSFYSEILPNGAYASGTTVLARGIDISKWNHPTTPQGDFLPLDWNGIKDAGIEYVILKAGSTIRDGKGGKETTFDIDYTAAHEAGLDVGVYFYTYATNVEQIKKDAELLLSILDGKSFEYPIYLDLEDDSLLDIDPSVLTEMCVTFFSILQKNGYYTGLYVNHEWLHNILQTEKMLDLFEIW
ncbi:MAG: hypothetical protein J6B55_04485, partial [Clostridia bacterium]|nr:hypothetical protein [Clostridia bacterium]